MLICVLIERERQEETIVVVLVLEVSCGEFVLSVANAEHEKVHGIVMRVG